MALPQFPINLSLDGRRVVLIGAVPGLVDKSRELARCGASVDVYAAGLDESKASQLDSLDGVTRHARPHRSEELLGAALVLCARDDRSRAEAVAADAAAANAPLVVVDEPDLCTATLPARIRQDSLLVTFSTAGVSPALASWLRRRFAPEFGPEYADLLHLLAEERAAIRASGRTTEGLDWQGALDSGMLELVREGRLAEAKERLQACLSSSSE